jgi:hypothetical protein
MLKTSEEVESIMTQGILVASDSEGEWLLPWWWEGYSCTNTLPVAFVDLGLSNQMKSWCEEKGQLISLENEFSKDDTCSKQLEEWASFYGNSFFSSRDAWFKKPAACLLSPFDETIWIDLDCEVLAPLEDIFSYLNSNELAVWFGSSLHPPKGLEKIWEAEKLCNSGVVAFKKNSLLIREWAKQALENKDSYFGDECILSHLIYQNPDKVAFLPEIYNWRMSRGLPLEAKIIHWKGEWGKKYIAAYGGLRARLMSLTRKPTSTVD